MEEKLLIFEPDYYQLFYDPEEGYSYYDTIYLSENEELRLDIKHELHDWLYKYIDKVLIPCAAEEITVEELNKTFDWKTFHEQGIKFAKEMKTLLPNYIRLQYRAPVEDQSGIIKDKFFV